MLRTDSLFGVSALRVSIRRMARCMSRAISPRTREICERYQRAMELKTPASVIVGELSADFDVLRPAIWKALRSGGVLPQYAAQVKGGGGRPRGGGMSGYTADRIARSIAFREKGENGFVAHVMIDREPCLRCGVRADVGCRHHSRARLGMVL